jgi:hypothetical protein
MAPAATAAIDAVLLAGLAVALVVARRARAALRAERLAGRLARERRDALLESVRRLGVAALASVDDVRREVDAAVRHLAPQIDGVLFFEDAEGELTCTFASGARLAYFEGSRIARGDAATLPARALRSGHRELRGAGERSFHPADAFALAVPLPRADGGASVLYVAAPRAVDASAVDAIVTLADHAAFAYALALEREGDLDRTAHAARVPRAVDRVARSGAPRPARAHRAALRRHGSLQSVERHLRSRQRRRALAGNRPRAARCGER